MAEVTEPTPEQLAFIEYAQRVIAEQSGLRVWEFLVSGAMPNELGIWHEPPLVEIQAGGGVVVHERMRLL